MSYDFDLFVIGAGSGGISAARRAAQHGAKVAIAESGRLGGTCVNRGCVPKKLMVYASHVPEQLEAITGYGWSAVESTFDWQALTTAVNNETARLNGIYQNMLEKSNVTILRAYARFLDAHTLMVGDEKVTADKILIAVGGKPFLPHILGIDLAITSDDIFHLPKQPERMIIIGGGYIGCEFASIMNGLGTHVTQIIRRNKILRGFDDDIRAEIQEGQASRGIRLIQDSELISIEQDGDAVKVNVCTQNGEESVICDAISLAAVGRRPNIEKLGIENTGVKVHGGAIAVDAYSQTAETNIFAVGDCTSKVELTPVAIGEGRAFADTQFGGMSRAMSYEYIPTAVFTTPEASTVGMTEEEAINTYGQEGINVYRSRFRPMFYTLPNMDVKTMMKLIVHQQSGKVIGAHMVGDHAAEIIQGVAIAVKMGATKADFDATVGIHPSSAEEFVTMR